MSTIYSNNIRPVSGTTDAISIDSSTNKVGINSSSPTSNLQIHEDSTGHCTIDITNTTTTNAASKGLKIGRGSDGAGGHGILLNYEDNTDWVFSTSISGNNATQKMRLTADGTLLVGGTSVANCFNGNGEAKPFVFQGTDSGTTVHSANNLLCVVNDDDTTGNMSGVAFGWTDTDESPHYLSASINCIMGAAVTGQYRSGDLAFLTSSATNSAPTEKMRISAAGDVRFGTDDAVDASNAGAEFVSSNSSELRCSVISTGNSTQIRFYNGNGEVGSIKTAGSATAFNTSSDYRLKENEVAISDGITRLKTLKPYRFNFKADPSTVVDGFFAHEVKPAVPEAISGEKDGEELQGIDQSKLVPLLTAALQESIAKIEALEARVAALESQA